MRANGAEPLVTMFPTRGDLEEYARSGRTSYEGLTADFERAGLPVLDLAGPLVGAGVPIPELFAPGGHLSPEGNELVASAIAAALDLSPVD